MLYFILAVPTDTPVNGKIYPMGTLCDATLMAAIARVHPDWPVNVFCGVIPEDQKVGMPFDYTHMPA
jgi:hypothetical protein